MNEVDDQVEGIRWAGADGTDQEYDSDDLSDSDGSEGEVPVVNDVKPSDSSNKPLVELPAAGAGAIRANPKVASWSSKSSTIANQVPKESSFTRGWKPVIDGKIQVGGETEALRVRSSSMPPSNGTSSSQKNSSSDNVSSASQAAHGVLEPKKDGNESDSDVRRVPEMAAKGGPSGTTSALAPGQPTMKRKRGGASADKEHKRLKRLLRNRVSAQQARERKKAYLSDLEVRAKDQTLRIEQMEEKINTLTNENAMLRQLLKTSGHMKKMGSGASTDM